MMAGIGTLIKILILIFEITISSQLVQERCPTGCECTGPILKCFCTSRQNITLKAVFNFEIKHVLIHKCGTVNVPLGAVTHLQLETMEFSDIQNLNIRPFALAGVQTLSSLRMSDISNLNITAHGLTALNNVTNIILSNVSVDLLTVGAFGGISNVETILIENSYFNIIDSYSFILSNITTIKILNSYFQSFRNASFLAHNSHQVLFYNCIFRETKNNSFTMSEVETLVFRNSKFGVLGTNTLLSKDLGTFYFKNCTVDVLEAEAFLYLHITKSIIFTDNTIEIADENSLFPSMGNFFDDGTNYIEIEDCCNSFTCDCNIHWMWSEKEYGTYNSLIEKSLCIDEPNKNLSILEPVLDSEGQCKTLELSEFISKETTSPYEGSASNIYLDYFLLILPLKIVYIFFLRNHI